METSIILLVLIGLAAGLGSGVFGIGGGVVIVPALVFIAGFSQHRATGTSLAVLLPPIGIAAVFEYARHGQVDFKAALIIAIAMFLGAWGGAFFANKMGEAQLKVLFGIFLLCLGVYTLKGACKIPTVKERNSQAKHTLLTSLGENLRVRNAFVTRKN